jgi:putative membrane protein
MYGYGWSHMGSMGSMAGMGLIWIFLLVLIVGAIWWGTQAGRRNPPNRSESAEEILRKRYARGEIDKNEFDERMRSLRS